MRQRLFRGQNAQIWRERLVVLGYSPLWATQFADFLTGELPLPPPWPLPLTECPECGFPRSTVDP